MADPDTACAGAKRKQRTSSAHSDALRVDADAIPLLTPSKRLSLVSTSRTKSPSDSPTSPLVIARSPSDSSRLWAARIAATQRIARRRGSGVATAAGTGGVHGARTSTTMAKRRALSLSPAAASFEASVSITTKLVQRTANGRTSLSTAETKKTTTTATTPPAKSRRRTSTAAGGITPRHVIDLVDDDDDVEMKDEIAGNQENKVAVKTEHDTKTNVGVKIEVDAKEAVKLDPEADDGPTQSESVEETLDENGVEYDEPTVENEQLSHEPHEPHELLEPVECKVKVEIKAEPSVVVKVETGVSRSSQSTRAERPPLAPSTPPSRRRTLFDTTETEGDTVSNQPTDDEPQRHDLEPHLPETEPRLPETEPHAGQDVEELTERLAELAATLAAERDEKAALKNELDALAARLRESEEKQQQLEAQLASLAITVVAVKEEHA